MRYSWLLVWVVVLTGCGERLVLGTVTPADSQSDAGLDSTAESSSEAETEEREHEHEEFEEPEADDDSDDGI